ncbi:MAG: prepilin-type N-terminal cleavage/methylation domain-containing protein [Planctomycetes bacterium]|nr:prepilin-type N-terminal cleavage/methylation domain-containing protein [Planctomycetota bacterium]
MTGRTREGRMAQARSARAGFSLMELVVSIAILTLLAGVLVSVMGNKLTAGRDARRINDCRAMCQAIESYLLDKGKLPAHDAEVGYGGWDTSLDHQLVTELVDTDYLREHLRDPMNDATHHYRYYKYAAGYEGFTSNFYVLGVKAFETVGYTNMRGSWKGTSRDWSNEFACVMGGTEK